MALTTKGIFDPSTMTEEEVIALIKKMTRPARARWISESRVLVHIGAPGELFVDARIPGQVCLRMSDGFTPGGYPVCKGNALGPRGKVTQPTVTPTVLPAGSYLEASTFEGTTPDGQPDTHAASYWTFYRDPALSQSVHRSGKDETNLTRYNLNDQGIIFNQGDTLYYIVAYEGATGGISASKVGSITRGKDTVATPNLTITVNGPHTTATGSTFVGSTETGAADTHSMSRWVFYRDEDKSQVAHDSGWISDRKTSYHLADNGVSFVEGDDLYVDLYYRGGTGKTAKSETKHITWKVGTRNTEFSTEASTEYMEEVTFSRTTTLDTLTGAKKNTSHTTSDADSRNTGVEVIDAVPTSRSTQYSRSTSKSTSYNTSLSHNTSYNTGYNYNRSTSYSVRNQWSTSKTTLKPQWGNYTTWYSGSRTTSATVSTPGYNRNTSWTTSYYDCGENSCWNRSRNTSRSTSVPAGSRTSSWNTSVYGMSHVTYKQVNVNATTSWATHSYSNGNRSTSVSGSRTTSHSTGGGSRQTSHNVYANTYWNVNTNYNSNVARQSSWTTSWGGNYTTQYDTTSDETRNTDHTTTWTEMVRKTRNTDHDTNRSTEDL